MRLLPTAARGGLRENPHAPLSPSGVLLFRASLSDISPKLTL